MTQALVIGAAERNRIATLIDLAAARVLDASGVMARSGADIAAFRDMMKMHTMELPHGYVVTYTHERQPKAPPPGICAHISISVTRDYKMPSIAAVNMILQEFGMSSHDRCDAMWIEDVDRTTKAINLVQLLGFRT